MTARERPGRPIGGRTALGHAVAVCAALLLVWVPLANAQSLHVWTEIDGHGTAVDWNTLERTDVGTSNATLTVWARTVREDDTLSAQVAVRCTPPRTAVVEVRRTHPDGRTETSGPVALSALVWQDPQPLSYLASVSRAVCLRTRDQRPRPC
jgi:hypothetical protein